MSEYRSKCRFPTITWSHPLTHATLARSSQPLTGLLSAKKNKCDKKFATLLGNMSQGCKIVDARANIAAAANGLAGRGGTENYDEFKTMFLNMPYFY